MENSKELIELKIQAIQDNFERRIKILEEKLAGMDSKEAGFSNSITRIEALLEKIRESLDDMNSGTKESFNLVHNRISSVKKDFEEHQQKELDNYISAKNVIIGAILTVLASTLTGALLSSFQYYGVK